MGLNFYECIPPISVYTGTTTTTIITKKKVSQLCNLCAECYLFSYVLAVEMGNDNKIIAAKGT